MKYSVTVVPKSSRNKVDRLGDAAFKVWVTAAPTDGKANAAVIASLAKYFSVAKSCVSLVSGESSRKKIIEICDT